MKEFTCFETEAEAESFCREYGWSYEDENGFVWDMDYRSVKDYRERNRYFYTFGSEPKFPYQSGWVEVRAASWDEAHAKFRARFPDRPGHEGILNCAFFYNEEEWTRMDPEHTWHGWKCFEIIE